MKVTVLEIKGTKSLRALNVFVTLCFGATMLPRFLGQKEYDAQRLMDIMKEMSSEDQEKVLRELAEIVPLEQEEIEALAGFCADSNGVPFNKNNIKNLSPFEVVDLVVAVCMKIVDMRIHMLSEEQKKNFGTSQLTQSSSL